VLVVVLLSWCAGKIGDRADIAIARCSGITRTRAAARVVLVHVAQDGPCRDAIPKPNNSGPLTNNAPTWGVVGEPRRVGLPQLFQRLQCPPHVFRTAERIRQPLHIEQMLDRDVHP
jgi:hypothetical protein